MRIVTKDGIHFIAENAEDIVTQVRFTVQSPYKDNESFMQYIAGYWNASIPDFAIEGYDAQAFLESMRNHGLLYIA